MMGELRRRQLPRLLWLPPGEAQRQWRSQLCGGMEASEGAGGLQLQTKAPAECCEEACDRGVHPRGWLQQQENQQDRLVSDSPAGR